MSINNIVNKHLSAYGEAFNFKRSVTPTKARKINRTIIGECLSIVAPDVIAARAENVRLRAKLRATYMVASGEASTVKEVADNSEKATKKSFGDRVKKIIEAIKKFFVQIFRFFTNNRPKLAKALRGINAKVTAIGKLEKFPKIIVTDLSTIKEPLDNILNNGSNSALNNDKNAKAASKGLNKGKTKEIKTIAQLREYVKAINGYVSRFNKLEKKVEEQKKTFENSLKNARAGKNRDDEKFYQERLKTLGIVLGNFQKGYGAIYKALGGINKVNTGKTKPATPKATQAKTADAEVVK